MALRPQVQSGVSFQEIQAARRANRRPQHRFYVNTYPWQIQPFMIAPVLPGETMKNLLLQVRGVTLPVANPIIGWWVEYYFFYVKHRDLDGRDDFTQMVLDPAKDLSAYNEAASTWYYHYGNGAINWTKLCLKRIVEEYFRNEGEAWDDFLIQTMPAASLNLSDWTDSMVLASDVDAQDIDVDLDADSTIMASEVERAMQQWQLLQETGLTSMSYEDYLRTYGIKPQAEELHIPELLRYIREWQYPTNTVNPANGTPTSAVSWALTERADKARFFNEPGFIVGVNVVRPKVYRQGLFGSLASAMNDVFTWLPAALTNDVAVSRKRFAAESVAAAEDGEGPISGADAAYDVDVRDLLLYGDQFVNFDNSPDTGSANYNEVSMPEDLEAFRYPADADLAALFSGGSGYVKQDGVVSLTIASAQRDVSPRTAVVAAT